jgi:hypothetical protein
VKEKLIEIIQHYGTLNQLKYLHTEYFELDEAILEYENDELTHFDEVNEKYKLHIAEELADTMVMLKQIQYYYDIEDKDIEEIMKFKIDRQLDRINNEVGDI